MFRRIMYIERGGDLAARSDEVLALGRSGPDMGDWLALDRSEIRSDAVVGREIVCAVPNTLNLAAQVRAIQIHADYLREIAGVVVRWSLHRADVGGDDRNIHAHINFSARRVDDEGHIDCAQKTPGFDLKNGSQQTAAMLRSHWQDTVNRELAAAGLRERLDLRTRKAQKLHGEALTRIPKVEYLRARRGQTPSTHYARNQTILSLRTATAALSNAAASLSRIIRTVAIGTVIKRRRERTCRARTGRRSLDFARASTRIEGLRLPGNRGDIARFGNDQSGWNTTGACMADSGFDHQWPANPHAGLDVRGTTKCDWRGDESPTDGAAVETRAKPAGDDLMPTVGSLARSLAARLGRWFSRPDLNVEQAETNAQCSVPPKQKKPLDAYECEAESNCPNADQSKNAERETIAPESVLPLIFVETRTGGKFYIKREAWLAAQASNSVNVPTCDWQAEPVAPGEKPSLRRTTVEASKLTPTAVMGAEAYILPRELVHNSALSSL